jgi:hypothetical protein
MAPRLPESKTAFLQRLRAAAARGETQLRFGAPHLTHAVVREGAAWRVRRLVSDPAAEAAYRAKHSSFMPEHAEMLSVPGPDVALEAATVDELVEKLDAAWARLTGQ